MSRETFLCCVLAILCISRACDIPKFNFTIASHRNETGHWYAEVHLNHESEQPWDVYVDRTTVQINGKKSAAIVAKLIPLSVEEEEEEQEEATCSPTTKFIFGYEEIPGLGYYKFHREAKSWQDAVTTCEKEDSHLIILNSGQEATALDKTVREKSSKYLYHWIGIHDIYEEGQYMTVLNQTLQSAGYVKWYNGKPKGKSEYNCVAYVCNPQKCGYDDWACGQERPFICEHSYMP